VVRPSRFAISFVRISWYRAAAGYSRLRRVQLVHDLMKKVLKIDYNRWPSLSGWANSDCGLVSSEAADGSRAEGSKRIRRN
jgi:hypothetical protein